MSITEENALKIMSKEEQLAIERMVGEGCVNQPADDRGQETEMPKTRKVRIALAIDTSGRYIGYGRYEWNDKENGGEAVELLDPYGASTIVCHFIEAEVPIPQSLTVEGIVDAG
jgi:hypothetical protein